MDAISDNEPHLEEHFAHYPEHLHGANVGTPNTPDDDSEEEFDLQPPYPDEESFESIVKRTIVEWALECNIARMHVSNLLKRLHEHAKLTFLPKDSRTLMSTYREKIELVPMDPGHYQHFDLESGLINVLNGMKMSNRDIPQTLELLLNFDGLPVFESSLNEFWPILVKVQGWDEVNVAGLYFGKKKPVDVNHYLSALRSDFEELRTYGLEFDGKQVMVKLKGMVCDAPASCFVKNIKSHTGYHACRKCSTKGVWISNSRNSGGRVTYPELDAPLRTDLAFRMRHDLLHHKNAERSIIEDLLSDVVQDDILDYMHLVCIGCHKKQIEHWINTPFDKHRWKKEIVLRISGYLISVGKFIPNLFPRKPRSLDDLPRWKATELRMDLLYICPVAYRPPYLTQERYDHLITLHVAIKILVSREKCQKYVGLAENLLSRYVLSCTQLYGPEYVSFNVHTLVHLANEVRNHGCLDDNSAFPFENKLQKLENLVRKSGNALQQVVKRMGEFKKSQVHCYPTSTTDKSVSSEQTLSYPHCNGPFLYPYTNQGQQFTTLKSKNTFLSINGEADNTVFLFDKFVVFVIENFVNIDNAVYAIGRRYIKKENAYDYPVPSALINEYVVSGLEEHLECISVKKFKCKAFRIPMSVPCNDKFFVTPLVNHTFQ